MYKISVPVMCRNINEENREAYLAEIKRFDAERVFLAIGSYQMDEKKRADAMAQLKENCKFFKNNGFEVGAWFWTFNVGASSDFVKMLTIDGEEISSFACPTDERFVDFAADWVSEVAGCGVDMIMFDDDFRYGFHADQPACLCKNHIAEINRITGEEKTREELCRHITSGGRNKYRDAYIKVNGDAFKNFAVRMRESLDKVAPHIRMGACACITSWDLDGVSPKEISRIFAGNTRPFVRLIGAPYWAAKGAWGNSMSDVIELSRMESAWTREDDIEIMAEGDCYPRPRTACPARYLEAFDLGIRISECTDGLLKYGIDYSSNIDYEQGYARAHERNLAIYKDVERIFSGKKSVGVRIYETPDKLRDLVMPTAVNDTVNVQNTFFSKAARMLGYNAIPTVYEGEGVCGAVFDENARHISPEALKGGLIIDIAAAEILTARGVDVGIARFGEIVHNVKSETFLADRNTVATNSATVCDVTLRSGAQVLSEAWTPKKMIPMSYRYENANGEKFLVLNINTRGTDTALKTYARSRQIADAAEWFGKKLPAYCYGNPALYMQAKTGDNSLAVGLWNFHADGVYDAKIELSEEYSTVEFVNCSGHLDDDTVIIDKIGAFEFACFEVIK